jgi:hypothetical protein
MRIGSQFFKRHRSVIGLVFFTALLLNCSNNREPSDTCKQASLETWTDEFIARMKVGYLPDDANQMAEVLSVKTLAQCMNQEQKKATKE